MTEDLKGTQEYNIWSTSIDYAKKEAKLSSWLRTPLRWQAQKGEDKEKEAHRDVSSICEN